MRKRLFTAAMAITILLMTAVTVLGQPGVATVTTSSVVAEAVDEALAYMATQQLEDGGIDAFGMGSSGAGGTCQAVVGVASVGVSPDWLVHPVSGITAMDYLAAQAIDYTHVATDNVATSLFLLEAGTLLSAVGAAGRDATDFGGINLLGQIQDAYVEATGAYSTTAAEGWSNGAASAVGQARVMIGLVGVGADVPAKAAQWLVAQQDEDGSWASADPDTSALCVVALVGSGHYGPTDEPIQKALGWFADTQLPSGGWRPWWDADPANASSTSLILQALAVCGYTPATHTWGTGDGDPLQAVLALQQADGRIGGTYANALSTADALIGLGANPPYLLGSAVRAERGLSWIASQQNADGSWDGWAGPDVGASCDAVLSFVAAGYDPATVQAVGGKGTAMDYLLAAGGAYAAESPDKAGKLALAVIAAGGDPTDVGGVDVIDMIQNTWYDAQIGAFGVPTNTYQQAFPILGLAAAGESVPAKATTNLARLQQTDGGWKYDLGSSPSSTTGATHTGLALQALRAAGLSSDSETVIDGVAFVRAGQQSSGGWVGANETAYALQGLTAVGEDVSSADWWVAGRTPCTYLASLQKVDGPMVYDWSFPGDNLLATTQGLQAFLGLDYVQLPSGELTPFSPVATGPDPDRMVLGEPKVTMGPAVTLNVPFGSDLDGDGSIIVDWRAQGDAEWKTADAGTRSDGMVHFALPMAASGSYELMVTGADTSGVQYTSWFSDTVAVSAEFSVDWTMLPIVVN